MAVCDAIGNGETFEKHLGKSKKANDAYIADAAEHYGDWLVSEDKRLLRRAEKCAFYIKAMNYDEFVHELQAMKTRQPFNAKPGK